jgi:pSer/pThr/pTyr-binding forkhead associated (FHA) protein
MNYTIGRDSSADISVADPSVSRIHADLALLDSGELFVTDRNSSNGSFRLRNGVETPIRQERLLASDQLKLGSVVLSVQAIISALRQQRVMPVAKTPAKARPSLRLVRCDCGAVKAAGERCTSCGAQ